MNSQERRRIGSDRIKRHKPEIQEAHIANDEVQSQGEEHV